jgi:lipopolysaccharide/colanic/teichoic acid biosynthesis glycosyltransferase
MSRTRATRPVPGASLPQANDTPGSVARRIKRAMDIGVSALALILLCPAMIVIALAIRLTMGSPVLFRQVRPGYRARPFELVKFRTMRERPGATAYNGVGDARLGDDTQRLSGVGRLLRSTSLDEIPQLWNILRGDMSLVGPRPLLTEYLSRYSPEEARRHAVAPGLTGLAQVNGRRNIAMRDRFAMDVWYVDHWSLGLDIRILAATVRRVATRDQAVPSGIVDPFFDADSQADTAVGTINPAAELRERQEDPM